MPGVSDRLKTKIDTAGIKYTTLSQKTGIPIDTISKIFLGKRRLMADELFKLCDAAGINVNELLSDDLTTHVSK